MNRASHHVVRGMRGSWAVRTTGSSRASKTFDTQAAAIAYGRDQARKRQGELYIHRADGMIDGRESYRSAPVPSKV